MADRIPLIVDSSSNQVKELPAGDSIILADNEKLKIGTGSDLQIYHDGSDSFISDVSGTGNLYALSNQFIINSADGTENMARFAENGAATLYHNNSPMIATTSTGATVTGLLSVGTSATIAQVALTSASSVTWDARAAANAFLLLGHNVTFAAPSNAVEGAIISVEIAQPDATVGPYTVAWNTIFEFAASTAPTMTATSLKTDIFSFRYNGTVWQEIGRVQNMAQT